MATEPKHLSIPRAAPEPARTAPGTRDWGLSDQELATRPLAYRDDLLAGQTFLEIGRAHV